MSEYIERDAAIEFIRLNYCKDCNSYNGIRCRACSFDDAMLALEDVPAADVAEVVRCKDCVFGKYIEDSGNYKCTTFNGRFGTVKPDDFCSYGERKRQNDR